MDAASRQVALLTRALGADPFGLVWPVTFVLPGPKRPVPAIYDPHNALLVLYVAHEAEFSETPLQCLVDPVREAPALYTRLVIFAAADTAGPWRRLGLAQEGSVARFWPNGAEAALWANNWGERALTGGEGRPPAPAPHPTPDLPPGWICRPAGIEDAAPIGDLLRAVFPDYPVPEDPGVIRYALAAGDVHGRLICRPDGTFAAYASLEFAPDGRAAEVADCATAADQRGRGLMTHLVSRLTEDLSDVFDGNCAYSLARADQPGMAKVLGRCGWRPQGRLNNHFRVGRSWLSADLWQAPFEV